MINDDRFCCLSIARNSRRRSDGQWPPPRRAFKPPWNGFRCPVSLWPTACTAERRPTYWAFLLPVHSHK